jgi:hypothetical protein
MREVAKAVKQAVVALLDGNLTYNSVDVPVFDGKVEGAPKIYVLIAISGESIVSNKSRTVSEGSILLSINNIRHATAQSEVLEEVSDQIKQALDGTVEVEDPLHMTFFRFDSVAGETVDMGNSMIRHMKNLTYRFRITQ